MTKNKIDILLSRGDFPEITSQRKLVETHISWVIICDRFVYKIKKPIQYSFLDFSTLELRKNYCHKEIELNQRFAKDVYLKVLPIYKIQDSLGIGGTKGTILDYAVKMRKMNPEKQMDVLLTKNKVTPADIRSLAERIAQFHGNAKIIYKKIVLDIKQRFNDLVAEKNFLSACFGTNKTRVIDHAIGTSDTFLDKNKKLLENRLSSGFFRDCHGDLHSRNIFLLPAPQLFDCLEFNDDYRHIDVLNEVAFLCMDLDAFGKRELSDQCIEHYNLKFPTMRTREERKIFIYYKCYRANIRAKVNSLRAKSSSNEREKKKALAEVEKYLTLMKSYLELLDNG
jgi:aminoglycoside phosphotransferase family enzyme